MLRTTILDIAERVGWTFVQAFAGSVAAAGQATAAGQFDWKSAAAGGGVAALVSLLKCLGLTASKAATDDAPPAPPAPAVAPVAPPADDVDASADDVEPELGGGVESTLPHIYTAHGTAAWDERAELAAQPGRHAVNTARIAASGRRP